MSVVVTVQGVLNLIRLLFFGFFVVLFMSKFSSLEDVLYELVVVICEYFMLSVIYYFDVLSICIVGFLGGGYCLGVVVIGEGLVHDHYCVCGWFRIWFCFVHWLSIL